MNTQELIVLLELLEEKAQAAIASGDTEQITAVAARLDHEMVWNRHAILAALRREVELEKDAARWRYARKVICDPTWLQVDWLDCTNETELDAAIDAALSKETP